VDETSAVPVYDEPTVMWRMRRHDGLQSHAVIRPRSDGAVVVWFINGRPLGFRDFSDWTSALLWSDQMQAQNWAVGWRLASDEPVSQSG
jgi:hypothetical protein